MPTGYTAVVGEGATFEQFVWRCARAFGALIELRDDSLDAAIPERFEPSNYHMKRLTEAKSELAQVRAMSDRGCGDAAVADYEKELAYKAEADAKDAKLSADYTDMIVRVEAWEPPSDDHVCLKEFMLEQLRDSLKFDCGFLRPAPTLLVADGWRVARIEKLQRDVVYHTKELKAEAERVEGRNRWVAQLRESVNVLAR